MCRDLGKTLLVRTLANVLHAKFSRIQFTPDLMPADLIGTNVLVETPDGGREFRFDKGPLFANIVLADEINRATPKTQSALLEAMQEHSVTVAGVTRRLEGIFFVLATQNPLEMEGTYPLPEAQLDRFLFKLLVKFPSSGEMESILDRTTETETPAASPLFEPGQILAMSKLARRIPIADDVRQYRDSRGDEHAPRSGNRRPDWCGSSCVTVPARAGAGDDSFRENQRDSGWPLSRRQGGYPPSGDCPVYGIACY